MHGELGPSAHAARKRPCRLCQVLLVQDRAAHAHPMAQLAFVVCDERDVLERRGPGARACDPAGPRSWVDCACRHGQPCPYQGVRCPRSCAARWSCPLPTAPHAQARACRNMQVGVAQERARGICAVVAGESLDDETAGGWLPSDGPCGSHEASVARCTRAASQRFGIPMPASTRASNNLSDSQLSRMTVAVQAMSSRCRARSWRGRRFRRSRVPAIR